MGNAKESCEGRYFVDGFERGSDKITSRIESDIKRITQRIVGLLEDKLRPLKVKKHVTLLLHFEGGVEKGTDPKKFGKLDLERAGRVGDVCSRFISDQWNSARFGDLLIENTYSGVGAVLPLISMSGRKWIRRPGSSRRVHICIRKIMIKPYVSPQD
jgi:hypothetical protein